MKRSALGKGIAALIPDSPAVRPSGGAELRTDEITPNPLQPRRQFAARGLAELAESIRQNGMLQPIIVTRAAEGGYHLVAGERRWRAAKLAGLERVPVVLRDANTHADQLALALIENLQREDLTPIEEARAYHHLRAELGLSQEEIAKRVGKERSTVANALRLLQLPLKVQEAVDAGSISAGHARAIAGVTDADRQRAIAEKCAREGWSVRELERHLRPRPHKRGRVEDPETKEAVDRLALSLGTQVEIVRRRRGGEIRLRFASEEELIRLFRRLTRETR
jgi:ParB family chromosome partitioning protein